MGIMRGIMCGCCALAFGVLLGLVILLLRKVLGFDLKTYLSSEKKTSYVFKFNGFRASCNGIVFNSRFWNSLLLLHNAPLRVNCGSIEYFEISIGWFFLGDVSVQIKGVDLLFNTSNERHYSQENEFKKMLEVKRSIIRRFDQLQGRTDLTDLYPKKYSRIRRILLCLVLLILRKIKIKIEDVRIRVEDQNIISEENTSVGVAVEKIELQENKSQRKTIGIKFSLAKQLSLSRLSFYWNPKEQSMYSDLPEPERREKLKLVSYQRTLGHCYVLYPCSPSLFLTAAPGAIALLKVGVNCNMDSVAFHLSKDQLRVATLSLGHIKHLQNTVEFLKYRPTSGVHGHGKDWWVYAFNCIRLLQRSSRWQWLDIVGQKDLKQKYAEVYAKALSKRPTKSLKKMLQSFEDELSVLNTLLTRRKVEQQMRHSSNHTKGRRRSWRNIFKRRQHSPSFAGSTTEGSLYSLSGQCDIGNLEVSLLTDPSTAETHCREEEIEVFTIRVIGSHVALSKEQQKDDIVVTVQDALCLGMSGNGYSEMRPKILTWEESQEDEPLSSPVLSVQLCLLNGSATNSLAPTYNYSLSCHLSPSVVYFDWPTVHRLAEFVAIVRGTHKDLRDAVKQRVKEVGRESKLRFRHFIANKEQAHIEADINLPIVLFRMEHNIERQLGFHFGKLKVSTAERDSSVDRLDNCSVEYCINLENTRLCLHVSDKNTTYFPGIFAEKAPADVLCYLATAISSVQYTTQRDNVAPSRLRMDLQCPEVYFGMEDGELETIAQFCYDQMTSTVHFVTTMNSIQPSNEKTVVIQNSPSHPYTNIPRLPATEDESEIFEAIVGEEDSDFKSQDDRKIFECDALIDLVKVCLKEHDDGPQLTMDIHKVCLSCQLKEQATDVSLRVSSITLQDFTHQDENHDTVLLLLTESEFLNIALSFADSNGALFSTVYGSTEDSINVEINPLSVCFHYECVNDLLCWVSRIKLPPFGSLVDDLFSAGSLDKNSRERQVDSPPSADAVQSLYKLNFLQLTVTLATSFTSSLITAKVEGVLIEYCDRYGKGSIDVDIQNFLLTDGLIVCDSPYHAVLSNGGNEPIMTASLSYELDRSRVLTTCGITFSSLKLIYLHKLIKGLQVMLSSLYRRYSVTREKCSSKLMDSNGPRRARNSIAHNNRIEQDKHSSVQYYYRVAVDFNKCSVKLPRDSFHPDALVLKSKQLHLVYNTPSVSSNEQDQPADDVPDTDPDQLYEADSQPKNGLVQVSAEMIEFNWNVSSMKYNIARTRSFSIDKISSCWVIGFTDIEIFLSGESLATVPSLISSNFSEKDPYALSTMGQYSSSERLSHSPRQIENTTFDPVLNFIVLKCKWNIQNSEGISDVTMATVELSDINLAVGKMAWTSGDSDGGESDTAVRVCVGGVCGVEGTDTQSRQKILTKYGSVNEKNMYQSVGSDSSVLDVNIRVGSNGEVEITVGLANLCLCLWPTFLHSLIKFKRQGKVKEGRRGKWWRSRRRSMVELLDKRASEFPQLGGLSSQASSTGSMCLKVGLEKCCLAFLENPSFSEVTTPGVVIEFHSNEQGAKPGNFQFEYVHYSSADWRLSLSSCWVHANLCLFGETMLPLTKVVPPSCLSLTYSVINTQEEFTAKVPSFECHITNELYEVICQFYESSTKKASSSTDGSSLTSDDIWSIKDFDRTSVLPERPVFEDTDGIDVPSDEYSDEEYDTDNIFGMSGDARQQRASLDFSDVTFNFDLMCSGDSDSVPIMCLHSCISCVIRQWSSQPAANLDLTLESFIYNERRAMWEPFIEPINTDCSNYKPYTLNIKFLQVTGLTPGEGPTSVLSTLHTSHSFVSVSSYDKDSTDSPKLSRTNQISINDSLLSSSPVSDHLSMPSPQSSQFQKKRLPKRTPNSNSYRRENSSEKSQDSGSGNSLFKQGDSSSEGEGSSIEEDKPTYVVLCTSNDRLELTVTPSALQTIQMYSKVLEVDYQMAMANIRNCVQDSRPPVRIENKTTTIIKVFPGPTFKDGDSSYNHPFTFHSHALRHFPSVVGTPQKESTDHRGRSRQPRLLEIPELSSLSPPLLRPSPRTRSRSPRPVSPSRQSVGEVDIPLFFESYPYSQMSAEVDDEDLYGEASTCSNEINDETQLPESSLHVGKTIKTGEIPVIEGSMYEAIEAEGSEETDFLEDIGLEQSDDRNTTRKKERSKKKSVCHLQLMGTAGRGRGHESTNKTDDQSASNYWKPKSLRKSHKIKIQMHESSKSKIVPVSLPGVFAMPIKHEQYGQLALICEVSLKRGVRKVLIKSGLQIKNTLPVQIVVYFVNENGQEKLGELDRDDGIFDVPLRVVANNQVLKFGVGSDGHPCNQSVQWKVLSGMENGSQVLVCPESTSEGNKFYIQASIKLVPAAHLTLHSPSHVITLEPALVIQNHLLFAIDFTLQLADSSTSSHLFQLQPCESDPIFDFPPKGETVMRFSFEYRNMTWSGEGNLKLGSAFRRTMRFRGYDKRNPKGGDKMYINIQATPDALNLVHLYTPYWIVNKTNLDLEFEHQPSKYRVHTTMGKDDSHPLMLTYKSGKVDEQHKVKLRVMGGDWSKAFVLGAIGKIINVTSMCRRGSFSHEFALETRLLDSTLTEIIYVMPKYSIINYTDVTLMCTAVENSSILQEDTSVLLEPRNCTLKPFWPGKQDQVNVSLASDTLSPQVDYIFSLCVLSPTVIKTNNEALPVMTIKVQPDPIKGTTVISIRPQVDPGAMLKIQNLCRGYCIRFMQRLVSGSGQLYPLEPNQSILYTWDCPVGKRELNWQVDGALEQTWKTIKFDKPKQKNFARIVVRKMDSETPELITIFWLTIFESSQLVLRFFDCKNDYKWQMELRKQLSPDDFQFFCSLEGLGISLVDNTPTEVAYCTILSSPVLWMKKRGQSGGVWSGIAQDQSAELETAFRTQKSSVIINDEMYDLQKMAILSNKGGEICREFNPGIWVWYSQCSNRNSLDVKLGRLQVDNQLKATELPTRVVFAEKDPTYAGDIVEVGVPFLDLQVGVNKHGKNTVREYEKVSLKIKPCQVNIELGLIAALLPYADTSFAKAEKSPEQVMKQVDKTLYQLMDVENLVALRTVNYVDLLQIYSTSVAVSYTTAGDYDLSSKWGNVVNAIIHFALITKGSFNISLKSVKISNEITDINQLKWILWGHYKNEMFWQFQHFALGLDVIGNPAKLFGSFQTGAKDLIFKSREGIAEGEAGSGIALGVKSLLGHVIGGGANSVASTTGSLGSMLLAATDINYQMQHRHMRQTDSSSIFSGGKLLVKGVFHGATDIFVKPATGAAKEGVEGFFKGIGTGAVSILVKPTLGLVELVKYSMEGVRSAVDDATTVQTVRRPRLIQADGDLRPYSNHESEGRYIFDHLSQPLHSEHYIAHQWLPTKKQKYEMVILVTSKQLLQLYKTQKQYCIEWSTSMSNINKVQATQYRDDESPELNKHGLFLEVTFGKTKREIMIHMEVSADVKDIQEKLKNTIKDFKSKA